jgi:hypothetical protein
MTNLYFVLIVPQVSNLSLRDSAQVALSHRTETNEQFFASKMAHLAKTVSDVQSTRFR